MEIGTCYHCKHWDAEDPGCEDNTGACAYLNSPQGGDDDYTQIGIVGWPHRGCRPAIWYETLPTFGCTHWEAEQ